MIKTRNIRIFLLIFIIVLVGSLVAVFVGYRIISRPERLLEGLGESTLSMGRIQQTATRDGKKEWSLEAGSAQYSQTSKEAVLNELTVTFFLDNDEKVYLKAEEGVLHTETKDIEVRGNVVLDNGQYRMETARLRYTYENRRITTEGPVRMTGDQLLLTADTLVYDLLDNRALLEGNVEGKFRDRFNL